MDHSLLRERSGVDAKAIAEREAEIVGKPQRIPEVSVDALTPAQREIISSIRASVGATTDFANVPGYFLTMVKHPEIFRCQLDMGTVIFKGTIPSRERELAVLRIGWLMRAPYEWGEHVDLGKKYGLTEAEVERVTLGADAPGWGEHDRAILSAVEQLLTQQAISDETWALLAKTWGEQQLIEFPMMVGQYVATAMVQNALRIRLASDNPGLTNR